MKHQLYWSKVAIEIDRLNNPKSFYSFIFFNALLGFNKQKMIWPSTISLWNLVNVRSVLPFHILFLKAWLYNSYIPVQVQKDGSTSRPCRSTKLNHKRNSFTDNVSQSCFFAILRIFSPNSDAIFTATNFQQLESVIF